MLLLLLLLLYDLAHPCVFTELSNLIVKRQGINGNTKPLSETRNLCQLRFHQIKDKELIQVSFTSTSIQMLLLLCHISLCHAITYVVIYLVVFVRF